MSGNRQSEPEPMTAEEQALRDLMREVFFSGGSNLDRVIDQYFEDERRQ